MASQSKSAAARKAEATEESVKFKFGGHTYIVPPQSEWPVSVAFAIEEGRNFAAARAILGDRQWSTFEANHKMGDLEAFFTELGEAIGANPTQ